MIKVKPNRQKKKNISFAVEFEKRRKNGNVSDDIIKSTTKLFID